jgi:hypothetical protein
MTANYQAKAVRSPFTLADYAGASGLRQAEYRLSSVRRARLTFSKDIECLRGPDEGFGTLVMFVDELSDPAIQITVAPARSLLWCDPHFRGNLLILHPAGGPQNNLRPLYQTRGQRTPRAICSNIPFSCLSSTTARATRIRIVPQL